MNKKGAAIHIEDLFGTFAIFIMGIVFLLIVSLVSKIPFIDQKEIISASASSESDITLLNFLRSPVSLDLDKDNVDESLEMSYLINLWSLEQFKDDSEYKIIIEEKSKKIFEKVYGECYTFEINDKNIGGKFSSYIPTDKYNNAYSEINYLDQLNNKINVKLKPNFYFYMKDKFPKDYEERCGIK